MESLLVSKENGADDSDETSDGEDLFQQSESEDEICGWTRSKKLRIKSRKYPDYNDNLLGYVMKKIKGSMS